MRKIIWALLSAGLLIAGTACEVEEAGGSSSGKTAGKPDVKVKATRIMKEFERNELRADAKYKGKVLQVAGIVEKVDSEVFDETKYVLRVGGGGQVKAWSVNCNGIPSDELVKVDKGQRVRMVGNFDDGGDLGVELTGCRLA